MAGDLKQLSEVADVLPGYSVKGGVTHDPAGDCQIVMGKHLKEGIPYVYLDADALRIPAPGKVEHYGVGPGDVLFTSRGVKNHAVPIVEVPDNTIASSTFYIVRARDGVLPAYLAWALNQPQAQGDIAQIRTGAGVPIVQRKALGTIRLPLPPLETQQQIARLASLMAREQQLQEQLQEETARYHRIIGQTLWKRFAKTGR